MEKIARCEFLRVKVLQKIEKIKQHIELLFYRQMLKFLAECEKWIGQHSPRPVTDSLVYLFNLKNSSGKKRGIHVPWSIVQLVQGCESTAASLTSLADSLINLSDKMVWETTIKIP